MLHPHVVPKTIKQRIYRTSQTLADSEVPLIFSFMDKIYISLDTLETYLSHQLYVATGVNCRDEGQVTCSRSIYSFLNYLFESIERDFQIDFFSRLNLDSANKWISWMTITGAQQTTNTKTSVISVLETFASLHKLFHCFNSGIGCDVGDAGTI